MNYAESIKFVFRQPAWPTKLLVLVGLALVPVVGWLLVAGYILTVTRNVIRGDQPILPAWTDFGRLFADGLKLFVVVLVWSIVPAIVDVVTDALDLVVLNLVDFVVQIAFSIVIIAASAVLATTGNIADGLAFPSVIRRVRETPRPYILAAIATTIIAFIVALVMVIPALIVAIVIAIILPLGFGIVAGVAVALLVYAVVGISAAHLTGQAYRLAEGSALPPAPRF